MSPDVPMIPDKHPLDPKLAKMPVVDLELPIDASKVVEALGMTTVGELAQLRKSDFVEAAERTLDDSPRFVLRETSEILANMGVYFAKERPPTVTVVFKRPPRPPKGCNFEERTLTDPAARFYIPTRPPISQDAPNRFIWESQGFHLDLIVLPIGDRPPDIATLVSPLGEANTQVEKGTWGARWSQQELRWSSGKLVEIERYAYGLYDASMKVRIIARVYADTATGAAPESLLEEARLLAGSLAPL